MKVRYAWTRTSNVGRQALVHSLCRQRMTIISKSWIPTDMISAMLLAWKYEEKEIFTERPTTSHQHRWFSGRMLACHAGGPGSIPGRCNSFLDFCHSFLNKLLFA